jgi:hypothetical protein
MQKVATELISISEEFGSVCDVAGFDNQAFIRAITASRQLQLLFQLLAHSHLSS